MRIGGFTIEFLSHDLTNIYDTSGLSNEGGYSNTQADSLIHQSVYGDGV